MKFQKLIPGVQLIKTYRKEWFRNDLFAGLSITAVALPIAIAYAQLAGFPPEVGIYSSIFPALIYAILGSSKQLVVNPDAAVCTIIISSIAPLAAGDPQHYLDLSITLSVMTGVVCIAGGLVGLGIIADFLSRPILTGYLNGIAFSIFASQLGTLLGVKIPAGGFFKTMYHVAVHIKDTHLLTLFFGIALFLLLILLKKYVPKIPYSLVVATMASLIDFYFNFQDKGVAIVGSIPGGFLSPKIPDVSINEIKSMVLNAFGIALVSFCSMMTTARSFAVKGGYPINSNRDMIVLGISDIISAISNGFAVSGADSRTAVADSSGGKTQLATIVAVATMALILLFLTEPMAYIPKVALAVILIFSSFNLLDFKSLAYYHSINKTEFHLSLITMLGVMTVGVLPGVLIAVGLTLFKLLQYSTKPHDAVLGKVDDKPGVYDSIQHGNTSSIPELLIYRFDSSLVFYNSDRFKERLRLLLLKEEDIIKWVILDAESIPILDITANKAIEDIYYELKKKNIRLAIARPKGYFKLMMSKSKLDSVIGKEYIFSRIHDAVLAFQNQN